MSCYEEGFRLIGPPSECSLRSKARIDALFEDSRSICSSTFGGWYAEASPMISRNPEDAGTEEQKRVNSAVQARIEAMFASVEAESGTPGECAAAILPVKYMGAAPVGGRVASVRGLQEPLRQLVERIERSVKAELEVSRRGLTFRTSEICEKNNPFRRIAVWSALKLRCKRLPSGAYHHAFLPLVGDQEQGQSSEDKHADLYRTMRGLKIETESYPPIFAVVMRRPGAARLLECHGFACETEEDAVAAAATLYRALLTDLEANRRRPRQTNGVGCISLASVASSVCESSAQFRNELRAAPARPAGPHPVRPPRTKKNSAPNSADESARSADVKVPRKKRNSDVKAEDILEARGRRRENKVPVPTADSKVENTTPEVTVNQYDVPALKQDWRNARNKQNKEDYAEQRVNNLESRRNSVILVGNQSEKIYEKHETLSEIYERCSNLYEKVPIKSKREGNLCAETIPARNSPDDPVDRKEIVYELNRGSYDLNRNESKATEDRQVEKYSPKAVDLYDKIEKISNCEVQESKNNGRSKSYEDHFRDADKIYRLEEVEEEEDSKNERRRSRSQSRNSEIVYYARSTKDNSRKTQKSPAPPKPQVQQESSQTRRRLARVVTMDKPLRKEPSCEYLSESAAREYSQPRVRKRSRAGSEPPVSRSEEVVEGREENRLKRSQSDLDVDRGDLMTRVELPRRGSFLTSGSTRRPNNVNGGTPLGFTELFDEFRNQEGLTSVDDILAAIIDPEGMSFNDLKPLYKEFLLKLAATLTQDELYQRSASIMRRRRRPQRRRSTRRPCLLGRAIKRSVSRLKGGPTEFTSVIFPARRLNDSFGSSSSCDVKNAQRSRVLASRHGRRRSSWKMHKGGHFLTTSEDSDTCRRLSRNIGATANRSSSGYVSCSECSYDSESCTCVSADKCYCSLTRRVPVEPVPVNAAPCACDTDSCSESNKCYCARRPIQPTILEQLRQRGIVPAESTLSRAGSPDKARSSKIGHGHASSRSLEFLKVEASPPCGSSDNLALDYDLFSPGKKSQPSSDSEKILVVSARDTQGRLVYVGGTERDKKRCSRSNVNSDGHHEALSIKKSAEIAAVFGADAHRIYRRTSNASSLRSSISLEAGLGYLP